MKKGTLTLFLLLAISIPLSAQYVVQGVVTDSLTKEPLPYASVRLKDTTEGTTTVLGHYIIELTDIFRQFRNFLADGIHCQSGNCSCSVYV